MPDQPVQGLNLKTGHRLRLEKVFPQFIKLFPRQPLFRIFLYPKKPGEWRFVTRSNRQKDPF
jgi:hypothetical protein